MGPVEVLVVTFPSKGLVAGIGPVLDDLVSSGHVRVVDAILVTVDGDGEFAVADLDDELIPSWSTISTHPHPLLSASDAELAAGALTAGSVAIVFVLEHIWPDALAGLAADSGGVLELHARIDPDIVDIATRVDA